MAGSAAPRAYCPAKGAPSGPTFSHISSAFLYVSLLGS